MQNEGGRLNYKYTAVEMGGDESCVVRRHAVRSGMREVGFETRFRNAHYYFCLKPGRQGAGGTQPIKEISAQVYRRDHPALFETL